MSISQRAIEHMEAAAQAVGFGQRDDYPFRSHAAISAGDWKGDSSAACVLLPTRSRRGYIWRRHSPNYLR